MINSNVRLILCRHGETEQNKKSIIQGTMDTELNETGRQQAEILADRIENYEIDHIYSSPLKRAYETAEILSKRFDTEVESHESFKEMSRGVFQGRSKDERDRALKEHDGEMHEWKPKGGESFPEVGERAANAIEELKQEHKGETIIVVAHGHFNRSLILAALGYDTTHAFKLEQGNVCINELYWNEDLGWVVERLNDTAHLG